MLENEPRAIPHQDRESVATGVPSSGFLNHVTNAIIKNVVVLSEATRICGSCATVLPSNTAASIFSINANKLPQNIGKSR